jgi:hypothetical protein
VAAELCVLLALVEVAQPSVEASGGCVLSHYRSLDPRVLAAAKSLRDRYVSEGQGSSAQEQNQCRASRLVPDSKGACDPAPTSVSWISGSRLLPRALPKS